MSLVKACMKKYIKIPELSNFKNVLFVGPHPDDIEFGCGATIDKMVKKGAHIHFLIVTDGAGGSNDPNISREAQKETRKNEALKAAEFLGVETVDFLEFNDGAPYTEVDVIKKALPIVLKYNPEIIFAPDPTLDTECHGDHLKVGRAIKTILTISPYPNIVKDYGVDINNVKEFRSFTYLALYFTHDRNKLVRVNKENMKKKFAALMIHESQMKDSEMMFTYFKFRMRELGLLKLSYGCEEYKVLHPYTQHVYSLGV